MLPEWRKWSDFVGLFIATGYVKGSMAQSLLLIAEPGSGKSALLSRFFLVPSVVVAMDATAEGLKQQVFPRAISERRRHLLLPEMYKLMQRRGPVADNTIGVLTQAMSGEMHDSFIGKDQRDQFPEEFQLGVIGAMPTKIFSDWSQTINNTGLLSRMYPVEMRFSPTLIRAIQVAIATEDQRMLAPVRFRWPDSPVSIAYPEKIGGEVLRLAERITPSTPNRFLKLLVNMVKAAAMLEGDSTCTRRHVELVSRFAGILRGDKPK